MAVSGNTQQSIRKALGVLKDSTLVGLAKVNSDYKGLDVAIVKATNHVEVIPKEKHVRKIFNAISSSRSRADVAYCINSLVRRLAKTSNWAVALKTLMVIHRALREVDPSFREEIMRYRSTRPQMLNLSHFKDDSSTPAWDYASWVRSYALFLEEKLECFGINRYDIETDHLRTKELETSALLEQLPALQHLLFRLICCQPEGAAIHNHMIRFALSMVVHESIKIHAAISTGTHNLADKFFDMERHDAIRALEIYRKAGSQAGVLNEFYKICQRLELGRPSDFRKVEQPPESFIGAMEEYIKNAPHQNMVENGREVLAIEYKKWNEDNEEIQVQIQRTASSSSNPPPVESSVPSPVPSPFIDLLCLDDDYTQNENNEVIEETNPLALALVSDDNSANQASTNMEDWELALVSAPVSKQAPVTEIKLAGGLDALTLDSLYDNATATKGSTNLDFGFSIGDQSSPNPFEIVPFGTELTPSNVPIGTEIDLFASNTDIAPSNVPIGTEIDLFAPNNGFTANNVPIGTEIYFFASNTEMTRSNVPIGTEIDFFANNTEITPNNVLTGTEIVPFNAPKDVTTPSTIPIDTDMDDFFDPRMEIVPSNVPVGTELGKGQESSMQPQMKQTQESANNPFGNPFM